MVGAGRQARSNLRKELMTAHTVAGLLIERHSRRHLPDLRLPGRRHRRDHCDPAPECGSQRPRGAMGRRGGIGEVSGRFCAKMRRR